MKLTDSEKLEVVKQFVRRYREESNMQGYKGRQGELSCFHGNEYQSLLWRSLVNIPPEEWFELQDSEILNGIYREILYLENCGSRENAQSAGSETVADRSYCGDERLKLGQKKFLIDLGNLPKPLNACELNTLVHCGEDEYLAFARKGSGG